MFASILGVFRSCWKSLLLTDVVFKVIAYVLLTPVVGLLFHLFLSLSGRTVLADVDILTFVLHPIGVVTLIVLASASVAIVALEQSALMAIALSSQQQQSLGMLAAFRFVALKARSIGALTGRIVTLLLVTAAPFLALGGGLYVALLTSHDINFYLAERPPVFWLTAVLIGTILAAMIAVLLYLIVGWSLALPLHLFEGTPARECLVESSAKVRGHRTTVGRWIGAWFCVTAVISAMVVGLVVELGRVTVPYATTSIWLLALAVGGILLLWLGSNFLITLLANTALGVILVGLYDRLARSEHCHLPAPAGTGLGTMIGLSAGRILAALAVAVVAATALGAYAMHSIRLDDHVQITAHRGASGKAPENTRASVRQAIEDRADWVEIDVQESSDGVVMVAHDSDLKKVAGADVKIWEATAEKLRSFDIGSHFDPRFKDERVPTLDEVLEMCKGKVKVNIELKYYGHDQRLEQRVIERVEQHGMESDIVVMSLKAAGLRKVKQLRPEWTAGLLTAVAVGDLTQAEADFLAISTGLATRALIRSAHRKNKQVSIWTVNDAVTMSVMIGRGADNIITDDPALARQVLAQRAAMSPVERVLVELAFFLGATPPDWPDPSRP